MIEPSLDALTRLLGATEDVPRDGFVPRITGAVHVFTSAPKPFQGVVDPPGDFPNAPIVVVLVGDERHAKRRVDVRMEAIALALAATVVAPKELARGTLDGSDTWRERMRDCLVGVGRRRGNGPGVRPYAAPPVRTGTREGRRRRARSPKGGDGSVT